MGEGVVYFFGIWLISVVKSMVLGMLLRIFGMIDLGMPNIGITK